MACTGATSRLKVKLLVLSAFRRFFPDIVPNVIYLSFLILGFVNYFITSKCEKGSSKRHTFVYTISGSCHKMNVFRLPYPVDSLYLVVHFAMALWFFLC